MAAGARTEQARTGILVRIVAGDGACMGAGEAPGSLHTRTRLHTSVANREVHRSGNAAESAHKDADGLVRRRSCAGGGEQAGRSRRLSWADRRYVPLSMRAHIQVRRWVAVFLVDRYGGAALRIVYFVTDSCWSRDRKHRHVLHSCIAEICSVGAGLGDAVGHFSGADRLDQA